MPSHPEKTSDRRKRVMAAHGRAVAAARRAKGLSQPRAAAALDVALWTLRAWEQGKRACPLATRRRVAAEWGGDPKALDVAHDHCPRCGRPYE